MSRLQSECTAPLLTSQVPRRMIVASLQLWQTALCVIFTPDAEASNEPRPNSNTGPCAANLQKISVLLKDSWAFSIAIDSATHQSTTIPSPLRKHRDFFNLHGCALPMHDRHTCQVMYGMLCNFLCVLCPKWQVSMLAVASDGARNMTGQAAGVVTRLQNYMHNNCPLFRIWCRAQQLDLVMEHIMTEVVGYSFFNVMLQFISHLSCQQKLIADMGTTCPCVVNRWLSIYKVTN